MGQPGFGESAQLSYTDWKGAHWTASPYGGWLVQTCTGANCTQSDSFSQTMDIVDAAGTNWAASGVGTNFLLTKQSPASTDRACPASALTGLSNPPDPSKCSSLVVPTIQFMGIHGMLVNARFTQPPVFTSLPAGLTFHDNGDQTATISGTPLDWAARPPCNVVQGGTCGVTASDTVVSAFQALQITVSYAPRPAIVSANTATFISGRPNSFLVVTGGATTPVDISFPCGAPSWLSLQDNHDGTAVLSATPPIDPSVPTGIATTYRVFIYAHSAGSGINYYPGTPCGLFPPDLTLNVITIPMFTSADSATFTAGQSGSATVSSDIFFGNPLVSYTGLLPGGTSFTPQLSAGTVGGTPVLSGALPTGGAGGDYPLTFSVWGLGMLVQGNADSWQVIAATQPVSATQQFELRVNQQPAIVNATDVNFTIGAPNTFTFVTTGFPQLPANGQPGMSVSDTGTLPAGVTFSQVAPVGLSTGVFALSGTPAASPAGPFSILLTANNGVGTPAHQTFTVHVIKPGDVNGDGKVDCSDVNIVKAAMGAYRDRIGYDYRADANNDGVVNALDLAYVTSYLPAGTACQ